MDAEVHWEGLSGRVDVNPSLKRDARRGAPGPRDRISSHWSRSRRLNLSVKLRGNRSEDHMKRGFRKVDRATAIFVALCVSVGYAHSKTCLLGERQLARIPCLSGYMTFPPRTEVCPFHAPSGWIVDPSSLAARPLGGTGGVIEFVPNGMFDLQKRKLAASAVNKQIGALIDSGQLLDALTHLALLNTALDNSKMISTGVEARLTLHSWGNNSPFQPCFPGSTTSWCPHASIPSLEIQLICLPG